MCRTVDVESEMIVRRLLVYPGRRSARNVSRLRLLLQEWNRLSNYWATSVHCGFCSSEPREGISLLVCQLAV